MVQLIDIYDPGPRPRAVDFLYELLKERPANASISHAELPTLEQHAAFVASRPYRFWYLINAQPAGERCWVGAVSASLRNEIGISIVRAHQRQGYARQAIEYLMLVHLPLLGKPTHRNSRWIANVAPGNEASKALFQSLGAKPIQITYQF